MGGGGFGPGGGGGVGALARNRALGVQFCRGGGVWGGWGVGGWGVGGESVGVWGGVGVGGGWVRGGGGGRGVGPPGGVASLQTRARCVWACGGERVGGIVWSGVLGGEIRGLGELWVGVRGGVGGPSFSIVSAARAHLSLWPGVLAGLRRRALSESLSARVSVLPIALRLRLLLGPRGLGPTPFGIPLRVLGL